ncbi:flagellar motor protein MotB [Teredinibacter purpureus]|uniref:flagellar motor protein MotB n=1 Tax=Teredinibacter purpureus TaxID=2731756 RepID=UPI0005F7FE83|nr:flagellar motor protein MotB [Teredinibacter purpureus]
MRRRSTIATKTNHERWLVSYSDFITLLFAFFVVMYSVSHVSESKYKVLSETLQSAFSQPVQSLAAAPVEIVENGDSLAALSSLEKSLSALLEGAIAKGSVSVWGNEDWVEIEVSSALLFNSGDAAPSQEARQIFADVAEVLSPFANAVAVSGHTDDIPIRNTRFDSNWELSSARAVAVVNLLAVEGVDPTRLSAIGYGEYQPIGDNATPEGRNQNRRVVLRVARSKAQAPREGADTIMSNAGERVSNTQDILPSPELVNALEGNPESDIAPNDIQQEDLPINTVEPIQLPSGGLLFTSDAKGRGEAR